MTERKRIVVNFLATYGRSVYAMACGLFSCRWTLMALGEVDYGLIGVVGGLTGFVAFFNDLLSQAVSRFFAYSVGASKKRGNEVEGLRECQKWFSTAVLIHSLVPVILVAIGYPVGIWAVENFLTIPPDRIQACMWVWRFVCLSCLVSMINVPFQAMYTAKQEIAELTIYSFFTTTFKVAFLYYIVNHPGDWMVGYQCWMTMLGVIPQLIILVRGTFIFKECRLIIGEMWSWQRIRQLLYFAGFRAWGGFSVMASNQGQTVVINKCLGPASNAAMAIGGALAQHSETLAGALSGALMPAITNAAGEGDLTKMRRLAENASTFGSVFLAIFAIPLSIEAHEVLVLWLKNPPDGAALLCACILAFAFLEKLTDGHWMSIFAIGKIGMYQFVVSWTGIITLPITWYLVSIGFGIVGVGYALLVAKILTVFIRLYFGAKIAGLSVRNWIRRILLPCSLSAMFALCIGLLPRLALPESFWRVCLTTLTCEVVFLPCVWMFVLSSEQRELARARVVKRFNRGKR